MTPLLRAGCHAALLQAACVAALSLAAATRIGAGEAAMVAPSTGCGAALPDAPSILGLGEAALAFCFAMIRTSSVARTARWMRAGFRAIAPRYPHGVAASLFVQLLVVAVALGVLAMTAPPSIALSTTAAMADSALWIIIWPALTSVAAAAVGATAHAAFVGDPG